MHRFLLVVYVATWFPLLAPSTVLAAKFNEVLDIGDQAPDWSGLEGVDGQVHGLADYRHARLLVLVFTCNHCPVATAYQDRIVALHSDYEDRGVQVVAVSVSKLSADALPEMKERAKSAGFDFPYLCDPSQDSARDYGATVTPQAFVLDGERKVAYMGRIDDQEDPAKAQKHYLREALDALLAGKQPKIKESLQRGCEIVFE